jgi:YfiH family protein
MPTAVKSSRLRRRAGKPLPPPKRTRKIESPWSLRTVCGVQILELAPLNNFPWLVHGFSTRIGGRSVTDSGERVLNLGFTDWDSRDMVKRNRRQFESALGADHLALVPLKQFHSAMIRCFQTPPAEPCNGDASLTDTAGLLLAVQTADCVPILLVDPKKRAIAAIHAGWRGTLARIAEKTAGQLQMRFGCRPSDLIAAVGPAIGACCYEVGTELVTRFVSQFAEAEEWFDEPRTGDEPNPLQWLNMMPPGHQPRPTNVRLDLRRANRAQLLAAGLAQKNIYVSDLCTACRTDLLFSYRQEADRSGRLLSAIGMRVS